MTTLLRILKFVTVTHRTVAAIAATVVITSATLEYLKESRRRNK